MGLSQSLKSFKKLYDLAFSQTMFNEIIKTSEFNKQELKLLKNTKSFADFMCSFVDDTQVFSETHEEHRLHLKLFFTALQKANMKISKNKTQLANTKIKIFNHTFDTANAELSIDKQKLSAILNWDKPASLYELNSRICILSYYTNFIPKLKAAIYPLVAMLREKTFYWNEYIDNTWNQILALIKADTRLSIPKNKEELYLFTDASKYACSGILMVKRNNQLKIVSCYSKLFAQADFNRSAVDKEATALISALKNFQRYMENSEQTYIFTDARSIIKTKRAQEYSIKHFNFSNYLQSLSERTKFQIFHLPGKYNILADHYSRAILNSRFINKTTETLL